MLPETSANDTAMPQTSKTIYINPNFKQTTHRSMPITTHINPLFLYPPKTPTIHMNPQFLQRKLMEQQMLQLEQQLQQQKLEQQNVLKQQHATQTAVAAVPPVIESNRKILTKSRMCIVREPLKPVYATAVAPQPLIRLTKRKLIRRTVDVKTADATVSPAKVASDAKVTRLHAIYKIDNRVKSTLSASNASAINKMRRHAFVARYALRRITTPSALRRKLFESGNKSAHGFESASLLSNRKLQLLNINGVLYKSTRNKLQRKDATINTLTPTNTMNAKSKRNNTIADGLKSPQGRTLFVRGSKFILDAQGFKLTRVSNCNSVNNAATNTRYALRKQQRIDIGGVTYVASKNQNVLVRTRHHLALAHLNSAKQRSLQLLTKRLVKSNVPCAIFQRLGKCIAYERGKCSKVHDKRQVTICTRFLRNECNNANCLLSHNVSLSKMPVCKFFLQGVCVRSDCPYLHKKLNSNADVCVDFLRGFCKLAEQCNKRHEFVCPEKERNGKCELSKCIYCNKVKKRQQSQKTQCKSIRTAAPATSETANPNAMEPSAALSTRYFNGQTSTATTTVELNVMASGISVSLHDDDNDDAISPTQKTAYGLAARPKVGILPAFIPLT